ncbi:MAG: hypothetical protein M1827_001392 [Pycnora praestabilis]|nr:MAG: hypothetical protein M1827_001392 [Pycnora praestabilis]
MENGAAISADSGDGRLNHDGLPLLLDTKKEKQSSGNGGHKRSLSGSILSRLSFLRTNQEDAESLGQSSKSPDRQPEPPHALIKTTVAEPQGGAMAMIIQQQKKTRKRKGSLRKTALLGTGKLRLESRERRASTLESLIDASPLPRDKTFEFPITNSSDQSNSISPERPGRRPWAYETQNVAAKANHEHGNSQTSKFSTNVDGSRMLGSPITSPTAADASTTDEDDMITFPRHTAPGAITAPPLNKPSSSGSDSYFPTQSSSTLQRRRSAATSKTSTTAILPSDVALPPSEWDYSATEWWGWVVLLTTWLVFVIGMGSCLGIWSWAWDVGETPYAPRELEDDPTLPIVGYYPALIILTGVMAWVWVVVAWVGMKYFKHAKISGGEEG